MKKKKSNQFAVVLRISYMCVRMVVGHTLYMYTFYITYYTDFILMAACCSSWRKYHIVCSAYFACQAYSQNVLYRARYERLRLIP